IPETETISMIPDQNTINPAISRSSATALPDPWPAACATSSIRPVAIPLSTEIHKKAVQIFDSMPSSLLVSTRFLEETLYESEIHWHRPQNRRSRPHRPAR